jgi:enamine deaminase RidA (YjgF/YER057c/UK114 family)
VAEAAGASLDQAVRVGIYLRDFDDFQEMNEIYQQYIKGDHLPVRTTLPVPLVGFDIEIDAILYVGD